jgi:hypothetical protein
MNHRVFTAGRSLFVIVGTLIAAAGGPALIAHGDVVQLRSGGQIEGKVARIDSGKLPYAVVQIDPRLKIAIPESQINRVAEAEGLAEYRTRAAATPAEAEEQYELARWCKANQLSAQARHHLQRAIALDPDHARARASLGFVPHDGKWIRATELQESRGLVSVGGKYRLPAEVMIAQAQREADAKSKSWAREIDRLRKQMLRGGDKGAEALAALAAIDDPSAALAIGKELTQATKQPRDLRMFWIEKLAQFGNSPALEALVRVGLSDSDSVVREKALETLRRVSPATAIANYMPMLRSNDNAIVKRAAEALSYFPDPELALPLVDALVTEHKTVIPADQSTNVGFSSTGSGGMSAGGKAKMIVNRVQNPAVLTLLRDLEKDVNFGYDQLRWRHHFAAKLSGYQGDMRRDN